MLEMSFLPDWMNPWGKPANTNSGNTNMAPPSRPVPRMGRRGSFPADPAEAAELQAQIAATRANQAKRNAETAFQNELNAKKYKSEQNRLNFEEGRAAARAERREFDKKQAAIASMKDAIRNEKKRLGGIIPALTLEGIIRYHYYNNYMGIPYNSRKPSPPSEWYTAAYEAARSNGWGGSKSRKARKSRKSRRN